jgi:hypothetical protein
VPPVRPALGRGGWPPDRGPYGLVCAVGWPCGTAGWPVVTEGAGFPEATHHAGTGWSRWQAGHISLPKASVAQPAAAARARLSASPSAAGSAKAAWHPAMAQQAAGTRIWSPMTQCPVIATG